MADCTLTTTNRFSEPAVAFTHSPASKTFSRLLGALAAHIEAERDIEDVASFDPAFMDWQRDAECARAEVLSIITELRHTPIRRREDSPLKRMNYVMYAMLQSTSTEEFLRLRAFVTGHVALFSCSGQSPVAQRVQQMLASAFDRLEELAALDTYVDPFDVGCTAGNIGEPATMLVPAA